MIYTRLPRCRLRKQGRPGDIPRFPLQGLFSRAAMKDIHNRYHQAAGRLIFHVG